MIIRHKGKASESLLKKILEVLERRQCTSRYPLEWIMQMLLHVLQQSLWLDQRSTVQLFNCIREAFNHYKGRRNVLEMLKTSWEGKGDLMSHHNPLPSEDWILDP